ncbi:hypothetical protein CCAL9344_06805 [Campylobacter sp. RM9344]|uniref:Uncharacterized protein n=1 Tax=Campylobacter californiensis TaxID=1032243 RepID=A0AAW3ZV55_9BACT|nr:MULTISPECIES: hypothetical protein [unclassified Campylobacter]MBE2985173.1 hypothetical protein [Campylobacter sp. RM6883]MBE2987001.1 hypothetical protein [Campylobacter sp. RM12919]MBE2988646.1 hypothetical protein [Campylobacter sp. RM12920]MBE2995250.1 hypothetical protein [Campylobacter sp. RM6913]MBE3022065.1 hypothetical protein [Campylobacter sp. 7477a]MBE3029892.1 hypothetical protein [Campylobacter sp. RM9344]
MAKDAELVNFSEDYELNNILAKNGKSQSEVNRKILCELGKECKALLGDKRVLTQEEFGSFLAGHLAKLEDKK